MISAKIPQNIIYNKDVDKITLITNQILIKLSFIIFFQRIRNANPQRILQIIYIKKIDNQKLLYQIVIKLQMKSPILKNIVNIKEYKKAFLYSKFFFKFFTSNFNVYTNKRKKVKEKISIIIIPLTKICSNIIKLLNNISIIILIFKYKSSFFL